MKHNINHLSFFKGVLEGRYILHRKFDATISASYSAGGDTVYLYAIVA